MINMNANLSLQDYLDTCDLDQNVKRKLSQHFVMTETGSSDILMSPIAKEHNPDKLFSDFDKVFNANRSKMNDILIGLEDSNRAKIGPRSIAIPWSDRRESLYSSFETIDDDRDKVVNPLFGDNRLRPVSLQNALTLLKNNTNSGLPYYTRKGLVKQRVLDKYDILLKRKDPCILFTRTQESRKTRNVWGYPMADTLNEMRYYSPLLSYQKGLPYRSALLTPDEVGRGLTRLILKARESKVNLLSVDFASYDTSVKSKLQKVAFNYIRSMFQSQYSSEIDYIEERFNDIGILCPDGLLNGPHGVPSGSTFTNEVDSIVQASIGMNLPFIKEDCFQVQGDDGVYLVPLNKTNELINAFESNGLVVSRDKTYLSQNYAVYLQNLFHIDYMKDGIIGGIYPVYRALNRIFYQERWSTFEDYGITGKDYYSIRTICILENCKYHPLFRELVKFIIKYDKYSLVVSDRGLIDYVQMINETKGAGEILNHQYGDNVAGIRSFETFKMIKELG